MLLTAGPPLQFLRFLIRLQYRGLEAQQLGVLLQRTQAVFPAPTIGGSREPLKLQFWEDPIPLASIVTPV